MYRASILLFLLIGLFIENSTAAELLIHVTFSDGKPAKGVEVQEVELERQEITNMLLGRTNARGNLHITFSPVLHTFELSDEGKRGFGVFRYVVMPKDYQWELSDLYYFNTTDEPKSISEIEWYRKIIQEDKQHFATTVSNWHHSVIQEVTNESKLTWNVMLRPGRDYTVHFVDQANKPIPNFPFSLLINLEALSHTGLGGEIPIQEFQTDREGCARFQHMGNWVYQFNSTDLMKYFAPNQAHRTHAVNYRFQEHENKVVFQKARNAKIMVLVKDQETQEPIPHAEISAFRDYIGGPTVDPIGQTNAEGKCISKEFQPEHVLFL